MPELPEVQTTVSGIAPYLVGQTVHELTFFRENLRYPLDTNWINKVSDKTIVSVYRRAKLIVMQLQNGVGDGSDNAEDNADDNADDNAGYLVWHLGMSGSLRIVDGTTPKKKHDHVALVVSRSADSNPNQSTVIRFHDPRRFGYLKYYDTAAAFYADIAHWGVEPLDDVFDGAYLYAKTRQKKQSIKNTIMDQSIVVGVGNIYACEALFMAGIAPHRGANRISLVRYERLAQTIKAVLLAAIEQGGTTLRDFVNAEANPGYFQQKLLVYGRHHQRCHVCHSLILSRQLGGRNSFYCPVCQT
ncbi:bifunctional DNA-formamidopyrimidine glycosylase/DNA-(apurinic or apyrimidinic site) lyase [Ostreibacterium oceani]|uniref:Formamidopyrimidine-DNA glycosylase n=1 Tax=Ostreibacterium oceani TaxID=2654998 RepID=A0A6N7EZ84_9GAMM|nr:bifunctional DNA-formamidopyrimidine glycosylase/DNA-(apurinic or apyrimidinic site) lyase [Ostreibacterium oceani]MPV86477.1 bifunctional DNA-formamidopyrimidine glycosylase/DNA-(apurinic or apyrimidinic site) lyase [Ostreibacterium oceani]